MIKLVYFSWVREAIGTGEETLGVPPDVATVDALIDWLATTSAGHARAFVDRGRLRAAVDQVFVGPGASIEGAREIAIFPPVTGG